MIDQLEKKVLNYAHMNCEELNDDMRNSMLELMQDNYINVTKEQFLKDLSNKQFVGLLFDEKKKVRGFTTFAINPNNCGTEEYAVVFSGDTIISPQYWGTIELIRGWCFSVASMMKKFPNKVWYWFLLSKGHRTYMYLPLFFDKYYPCVDADANEQAELFSLLERLSEKIYPSLYVKGSGIIRFPNDGGELKEELAKGTFEKSNKKHVKWFLEKNPGFYLGDELICLCKIDTNNMRGFAKEFLSQNLS